MSYTLEHNTEKNRFEVKVEGATAIAEYKLFPGGIAYTHTEVPKQLEGKGIGSFIAKGILDYAQEHNLHVKPYCSFIKAYIDRHPEYQQNSVFHNKDLQNEN